MLPIWSQNIACSLYGLKMRRQRYNKSFHNFLEFLEQSEWWSYNDLKAFQEEQLHYIIHHAYNTVPYITRQ